mmetsp:Transcript_34561/g.97475  ORF Transcript_34561/g.97475 Transcript_34561/m.97475 type:complete len:753 (+) Transcript_34561:3-2261(+)
MKLKLGDVDVHFPYPYMYPEQLRYMQELKRGLDAKGHCLLEMPTGTGKTVTLLSLVTSYQLAHPEVGKFVYCTRTVPEMEKVLEELKHLVKYREAQGVKAPILALGLSSRKNMCIHPGVVDGGSRESVDAKCRQLTASWVRDRAVDAPEIELCPFFEEHEKRGAEAMLPAGVYSLQDLRAFGRQKGWCPYFLARHMMEFANVVVYNYQYMLDPKVSNLVSRAMERECIVAFDEAHNIDNVCIEALSVNLREQTLNTAARNIGRLNRAIEQAKATDADRLRQEYQRLVQGLVAQGALPAPRGGEDWLQNPALPSDILNEAVPGNIRRAEHFVAFLRRLTDFLKLRLNTNVVESESPATFLDKLKEATGIDSKSLRFCYSRLNMLLKTLEIVDTDDLMGVSLVADFATLIGTYQRGFAIIIEPFDERLPSVPDPVIQLCCLDASLTIRPVFEKFQSVIITSGTLSPIDMFPKILDFHPVVLQSLPMSLARDCICPVILTKGNDQTPVSSKFDLRHDMNVIRNYGKMLVEMAQAIPDGLVCFFVSYLYMDQIVSKWNDMGILQELMQHKLVFIETQDVVETTLALDNYRRACDCGRGAVFFSVARGKVSEGIDFDKHYGRAVIMFGIPFQYTLSRILRARLEYLRETFQIPEKDFLSFDAIRQAAQCVGRVIRSKSDYGMMVFADSRYARLDKREKLPGWITSRMKDQHLQLSVETLLQVAREFMREMAQPFERGPNGLTLLSEGDANALSQAAG